jgi:hypothetical protein
VAVYFEQFFLKLGTEVDHIFGYFFQLLRLCNDFGKKWVGLHKKLTQNVAYILGDFFTNSSGHPGPVLGSARGLRLVGGTKLAGG